MHSPPQAAEFLSAPQYGPPAYHEMEICVAGLLSVDMGVHFHPKNKVNERDTNLEVVPLSKNTNKRLEVFFIRWSVHVRSH